MRRSVTVARVMLGAIFLVFGFDGVLHFVPLPPMPSAASAFIAALVSTKLFYLVKAIEILAALLLLSGRYVALALALLAPIVVNILWFDAALDPKSLGVGALLAALEGWLLYSERKRFAPLFAGEPAIAAAR